MPLTRRFLAVGARRVHYLRQGNGPPAILIHSSPANARLLMPEIERLSGYWTIFAFDTPGFGLSDPLPMQEMTVADLADALAETLEAIGMPRCPVYGTHTGAAIALEFGVRHPDRVTGLVLDGVPAFTEAECTLYFGDYFRKLPVTDLGGHYAEVWTRFRDQSIWFPWSGRRAGNLNPYDLSAPESTHLWASMYFDAADHYTPAYRAASHYGQRAIAAAAELTLPAIYTATETDMLYPHLQRLPPMKPGQEIRGIGRSYAAKYDLIAEGFARFGSGGLAPPDRDEIGSSSQIERQFLDAAGGGQLHIRYAGDRSRQPFLLLHDAPGSAAMIEPLIAALAQHYFVVAPDLPGQGESGGIGRDTPEITDFADTTAAALSDLAIGDAVVYGIGFGASVAVALARSRPDLVTALLLRGVLLPDAAEREGLRSRYAPPIPVTADGGHWYRTWLMLRDSLIYWPWYERRLPNQRGADGDFSARRLHRWTLEVMRSRETYAALIHAAFDHDAASDLAAMKTPILLLSDPGTPLSVYDDALAGLLPGTPVLPVAADTGLHAAEIEGYRLWPSLPDGKGQMRHRGS